MNFSSLFKGLWNGLGRMALWACMVCLDGELLSQENDSGDSAALVQVCERVVRAVHDSNMEQLTSHLHPRVVFTGLTGRVYFGHGGVNAHFAKILTGPEPALRELKIVREGAWDNNVLSENHGMVWGNVHVQGRLANGVPFGTRARLTCTLVKENTLWLVSSWQLSADLFDNGMLDRAKATVVWSTIVAGAIALLLGFFMGWLVGRAKRNSGS